MSLLSRERIVVGLAPDTLSAIRLAGRWRRRLLDQHASPVPAVGYPPWTGGIEALEILLDDPAWGGREITVVLSGHFVRYAVLPAGKRLPAAAQLDLARMIFGDIYGDLAHDWELRVSPDGEQPKVASGVPVALLGALRAACEGRGPLRSIQPGLMAVVNRARSTIDRQSGTLAVVESGRVTLAVIEAGEWQSIASRAADAGMLPDLLAEARELSGREDGGRRLWLCDLTGEAALPSADWQLQTLTSGQASAGLAGWGQA